MSNDIKMNDSFLIPDLSPELERGPKWLRELRYRSRDEFNRLPLPRRGLHLWRYTDPNKFLVDSNSVTDSSFGIDFESTAKDLLVQLTDKHLDGVVTDQGGRVIRVSLSEEAEKAGVVVCRLSDAVEQHGELVEKYLYQQVNSATGKFEAMNSALWNDGVFVYIPDGVTVERPIHLLREAGLANSAQYPRLLAVVGKNAELNLVDEYTGGSPAMDEGLSYSNSAVEIFGLQDSRTRYVSLQRQAAGMNSYMTHRAKIEDGATMFTIPLAFGAALSKANFGVTLAGKGTESRMYGMLFGSGRQMFDNHTMHQHTSGETWSNIDFKVVLRDKANSAYTGLIRIENDAKTCEAYQENRNLLLNKGAKAETIPELEILNEDVSCSHGATIGPIDPMSIFYLNSRGIDTPTAVRMIVAGYVEPTVSRLPEDLKERVRGYIMKRLESI